MTYELHVFILPPTTAGGLLTMEPIYEALRHRGFELEGECVLIAGMPVEFLPAYNALLEEALAEAREESYAETKTRGFLGAVLARHQLTARFDTWNNPTH